jgi:hypothetical protein
MKRWVGRETRGVVVGAEECFDDVDDGFAFAHSHKGYLSQIVSAVSIHHAGQERIIAIAIAINRNPVKLHTECSSSSSSDASKPLPLNILPQPPSHPPTK